MSWEGLQGSSVTLVESPVESDRFGLHVTRLTVGWEARPDGAGSVPNAVDAVRRVLESDQSDLIIIRYASQTTGIVVPFLERGRVVLPAGTLVYWSIPTSGLSAVSRPRGIEVKSLEDLGLDGPAASDLVMDLTSDAFADYRNHYSANPLLSRDTVRTGYQEWATITATTHPAGTLVLLKHDEPIGLATTSRGQAAAALHVEVLLAGLRKAAQAHGYYGVLLAELSARAYRQGLESLFISTQAHNVQVQRVWARLGLRPMAAIETAHAVSPSLMAAHLGPVKGSVG